MWPFEKRLAVLGVKDHEYLTDPKLDEVSSYLDHVTIVPYVSICIEDELGTLRQCGESRVGHRYELVCPELQIVMDFLLVHRVTQELVRDVNDPVQISKSIPRLEGSLLLRLTYSSSESCGGSKT